MIKKMKLVPITKDDFTEWSEYRREIYPLLSIEFDLKEIEIIYNSELWHCWFIVKDSGEKIGLVELSLRNIVDGCLSTPVPYLEGLYLIPPERGRGRGTEVIEQIKNWCRKYGYTELATDAELTNFPAQNFYEKIGFELVDKVVEYKLDFDKK